MGRRAGDASGMTGAAGSGAEALVELPFATDGARWAGVEGEAASAIGAASRWATGASEADELCRRGALPST